MEQLSDRVSKDSFIALGHNSASVGMIKRQSTANKAGSSDIDHNARTIGNRVFSQVTGTVNNSYLNGNN